MCEKRTCKVCKIEKNLLSDFSFHISTGYFHRTCKNCQNSKRREDSTPKNSRKDENDYCIRQKTCIKCGEAKDRNKDNFKPTGGNLSKICRVCHDKILADRKVPKAKGPLDDTVTKICMGCNEEKCISDFYYSPTKEIYYTSCIQCHKKYKSDKTTKGIPSNNLMRAYRTFDEHRGLEFSLTKDYIEESLTKPCSYCSHPSTGLDRLDNNLGHTIENTIPCCRDCNTAKMNNFTTEEMYVIGKAIKEVKDKRLNT